LWLSTALHDILMPPRVYVPPKPLPPQPVPRDPRVPLSEFEEAAARERARIERAIRLGQGAL